MCFFTLQAVHHEPSSKKRSTGSQRQPGIINTKRFSLSKLGLSLPTDSDPMKDNQFAAVLEDDPDAELVPFGFGAITRSFSIALPLVCRLSFSGNISFKYPPLDGEKCNPDSGHFKKIDMGKSC